MLPYIQMYIYTPGRFKKNIEDVYIPPLALNIEC